MQNIYDVLPSSMLVAQIDNRFVSNGSPWLFVDGVHIPTARNVRYDPGQPALNPLALDAREAPALELRSFGDYGQIVCNVATEQVGVLERVIGMGAMMRTRTEINGDRVLGAVAHLNPPLAPADVTDAWFALIKMTSGGTELTVPRLPVTDIDDTTDYLAVSIYDSSGGGHAHLVTSTSYGSGVISVTDWFLGTISVTSLSFAATTAKLTYDPSEVYSVTLNSNTIAVDYVDPNLQAGDTCCIVGVTCRYGQLPDTGSYSLVQPYESIVPVAIDFIECLGDAAGGNVWRHDRFFNCEQVNMPAYASSPTDGNAREVEFRWRVKPYTGRFAAATSPSGGGLHPTLTTGGASYFKETDYLIL